MNIFHIFLLRWAVIFYPYIVSPPRLEERERKDMTYKNYTRTEFIKKFGNSKRHFNVYKQYDYLNREYIYEVRSIKNQPHENHEKINEILDNES